MADGFDPRLIRNSRFFGLVRIGPLHPVYLEFHDLSLPVGIYNSTVISCDIGEDVAIMNVRYLAHYLIDPDVILLNIDEMHATDHAKFGEGFLREGEPESIRVWLEVMNENGRRKILPLPVCGHLMPGCGRAIGETQYFRLNLKYGLKH